MSRHLHSLTCAPKGPPAPDVVPGRGEIRAQEPDPGAGSVPHRALVKDHEDARLLRATTVCDGVPDEGRADVDGATVPGVDVIVLLQGSPPAGVTVRR
jgi:hypothetical protein